MSKPRWRIVDDVPEPVIDWDEIHAMDTAEQIPHMKELLKIYGSFLLNSDEFNAWVRRNHEEIIEWHKQQNT